MMFGDKPVQLPELDQFAPAQTPEPKRKCRRVLLTLALLLSGVMLWHLPDWLRHPGHPAEDRGSLHLGKCENADDPMQCGHLIAPLDYTNLSDPRNASIAVAMYPAGAGKTPKDEILGSILLNPGGPGGSGVSLLTRKRGNSTLGAQLDRQFEGKYNLVSFDPRGVGATTPRVSCFEDDFDELIYLVFSAAQGLPGHHGSRVMKHEIGSLIATQQLEAHACTNNKDAELLKFVGTAFVARDMRLLHQAMGDEKLNYWGFSYGTVLGSTYAGMFPDDVNRMIIDGVVDVPNYYLGEWSDNLKDTDSGLDGFFEECIASGPEQCELSKLSNDPVELRNKVLAWADDLKVQPIALPLESPPQLLSYTDVNGALLGTMYAPSNWPWLADALYNSIAHKNYTALYSPRPVPGGQALYEIACSDTLAEPLDKPWSIEDYTRHVESIRKDSPLFGDLLGPTGLMCRGLWQVRAAERYTGKFDTNTSFPILMLGNDYDPITPGRYADKMADLFQNAMSVRRRGYGHCSTSQPSKCMDAIVRNYFVDGELPALGTVCDVDKSPFDKSVSALGVDSGFSSVLGDAIADANKFRR